MKVKNDKIFIQIICLLLAVILWVFVMGEMNPKIDKDIASIPVRIRNENVLEESALAFVDKEKENYTIDLKVTGYRDNLVGINKDEVTAYIDVLGYSEGTNKVPVEIELPEGVEIKEYSPKQILCNMEAIITKNIDVEVIFEGSQAEEYYASEETINSASVIVRGPRSIVNSATRAIANVNLDNNKETIVKSVPISILSDTGYELSLVTNPNIIEVTVPIMPIKAVEVKTQVIGEPREGYKMTNISIEPQYIKISADSSIIGGINEVNTEPIDITGLYYPITRYQKIIDTDNFIITGGIYKPQIKIEIEKIIQRDFIYTNSDINYINVPDGLEISSENLEASIVVTVDGVASVINQFSKDDLILKADLSECTIGDNKVSIVAEYDANLESVEVNKDIVDIEMKEVDMVEETDNN